MKKLVFNFKSRDLKKLKSPKNILGGKGLNLSEMSKKELETYGRTLGVELDRRHSKKDLVKELKDGL